TEALPRVQLISEMLGRDLIQELDDSRTTQDNSTQQQDDFVTVENLARKGLIEPINMSIKRGEAIGLAGLLGSGRTETALLIFGIKRNDRGQIYIDGKPVNINSPRQA